jgi:uncharacterized protein YjiS (DUF1127 family)
MTQKFTPFETIDHAAILRRAHELRNESIGRVFGAPFRVIDGFLKRHVVAPLVRRSEHQRQLAELRAMDDNMLRDIGISRGNIEFAFRHGRDSDLPLPANANRPHTGRPQAA